MTPSYRLLYAAAVAVTLATALLALILAADPVTLGISPLLARWLGILAAFLGTVAGFLPRVNKAPNDTRKGLD